jgi:hypothetical protein
MKDWQDPSAEAALLDGGLAADPRRGPAVDAEQLPALPAASPGP